MAQTREAVCLGYIIEIRTAYVTKQLDFSKIRHEQHAIVSLTSGHSSCQYDDSANLLGGKDTPYKILDFYASY